MLKNYLKTAIRNILRYKGFSFINILGLAIGITGCLVIGVFVWDEMQYDRNIPGGENIYRIYEERNDHGNTTQAPCVPPAFAGFLQTNYPEVNATARVLMSADKFLMEKGEKRNYESKGWYAEHSFFQVFPFKFLEGDAATALKEPNAIVITKDIAERYFGNEEPINKTIKIDKSDFVVKGVLDELPERFHFDFHYLMSLPAAGIAPERMEKWSWHQFYTYVKFKPGTDVRQVTGKFQAHLKKNIFPTLGQDGAVFMPFFQQLKDIHLNSAAFIYDNAVKGNQAYVKALSIIALFVLVIACFNFINLATARSFRRAKEIGVRKVLGAERKQIVFQFLGETMMLSLIAVIIATIATLFLIPVLNEFTGKAIQFNPFIHPGLGLLILAGAIVIGLLAGVYPALVLSGFQPIRVLKRLKITGNGNMPWLRQALVVVQFALSALLIVSAIIVYDQTNYLNKKDLGFNNDQVVYFQVRDSIYSSLEAFKSELKRSPNVVSVTSGYGLPGDQYAGDGIKLPTKDGEKDFGAKVFIGDHDYIKTLGLRVIAGRDFSKDMPTDVTSAFIINETAVKEFGFETPEKAIGKDMYWDEWSPLDSTKPVKRGKVIGVVKDFHYTSLHEKLAAAVIQIYPQVTFKVAVKVKDADISNTIAFINDTWKRFVPGYPLDYKFMDETYGTMYKNEQKLASLLWIFTMMAIFVGCMGLFGLAAFSAEQRTKEIGIRKVLGASVLNIMGILSKNFIVLVSVSSLIAFPLAWWAMNKWLEDFPYRVAISWWVFAVALIAALSIALITISLQSIKAATVNPVKSLRTE
jgi:putative ABC transport system permease protein